MWTLDRFVVLSLMEDLHIPEVDAPEEWNLNNRASDAQQQHAAEGGDGSRSEEAGVLSAGSATDAADEPKSRIKARLSALQSLPALAARLGSRWASAELIPFLLRCVQEDEWELTRAVAVVLPTLVLKDQSSPTSATAVLIPPSTVLPVMVALCGVTDAVTRHLCACHTIPKVIFGVSLVTPASLWEVRSPVSSPAIFKETTSSSATHPTQTSTVVLQDDGVRSTLLKDVIWPTKSEQSDVPAMGTDPFDRALAVANVILALRDYAHHDEAASSTSPSTEPQKGIARAITLLETLLHTLAQSPTPYVAAAKVECISLLIHAVVNGLTISASAGAAESSDLFSRTPTSELHLRQSITFLVTKHILGCFCADPRFSKNPVDVFHWIMSFLPSSSSAANSSVVVYTRRKDVLLVPVVVASASSALRIVFDREVNSLDSRGAVATMRALPHFLDPVSFLQGSETSTLSSLLTLSVLCGVLEQALMQRQLRVGGGGGDNAAAVRFREDLQSYAQRHDDSFAGSTFVHFHAVSDAVEGLLKRMHRLLLRSQNRNNVSLDSIHRVIGVVRLYLARGTNFSHWKNRFFALRRAGHIIEALIRVVVLTMSTIPRGDEAASKKRLLEDVMSLLHTELLGRWYVQLCGDTEPEVRCAVAHHVVDPFLSIAWLLVNSAKLGCSVAAPIDSPSSGPSLASNTTASSSSSELISRRLFRVAQDMVACTQVCVMDVNDRVRASAAASISRALSLQAYGRAGISSQRWASIAATPESRKLTDALIALVMDLFRDESHLVLLSVMETFGEVCLHQEPVEGGEDDAAGLGGDGGDEDDQGSPLAPSTALSQQQQNSNNSRGAQTVQDIVLGNMERELVALCRSLQSSPTWRVREAYAALVSKLTGSFLRQITFFTAASTGDQRKRNLNGGGQGSARRLQELLTRTLLPMLVDVLFDPVRAVRDAAVAAVVADLTLASARIGEERVRGFVNDTLWPLVQESQRGNSTYLLRSSMLLIAVRLGVDLEHHMFSLLDQLSHDSVVNVRLVVARAVEQFLLLGTTTSVTTPQLLLPYATTTLFKYVVTDAQKTAILLPLLRGLVEDASQDVRECASKALAACV